MTVCAANFAFSYFLVDRSRRQRLPRELTDRRSLYTDDVIELENEGIRNATIHAWMGS